MSGRVPTTSVPTGQLRGGISFQSSNQPKPNQRQAYDAQSELQKMVGGMPLPVDTTGLLASQQALQDQINGLYAQAKALQARGYGSILDAQGQMNALLGQDVTRQSDEEILRQLEIERLRELNGIARQGSRAFYGAGFQRNG